MAMSHLIWLFTVCRNLFWSAGLKGLIYCANLTNDKWVTLFFIFFPQNIAGHFMLFVSKTYWSVFTGHSVDNQPKILQINSKNSDQPEWMAKLIRVFLGTSQKWYFLTLDIITCTMKCLVWWFRKGGLKRNVKFYLLWKIVHANFVYPRQNDNIHV